MVWAFVQFRGCYVLNRGGPRNLRTDEAVFRRFHDEIVEHIGRERGEGDVTEKRA